jgi:hypothetical protein
MKARLIVPSSTALAGRPPPERENARPSGEAKAGAVKQDSSRTSETHRQASPLKILRRSGMRCGPTNRRLFLADARAGSPDLWSEVNGGPR